MQVLAVPASMDTVCTTSEMTKMLHSMRWSNSTSKSIETLLNAAAGSGRILFTWTEGAMLSLTHSFEHLHIPDQDSSDEMISKVDNRNPHTECQEVHPAAVMTNCLCRADIV